PKYFDRLPERGYALEDPKGQPLGDGVEWMLTPEQAKALKETYAARTGTTAGAGVPTPIPSVAPPETPTTAPNAARTPTRSGDLPTPNIPNPPASRDSENRNTTTPVSLVAG